MLALKDKTMKEIIRFHLVSIANSLTLYHYVLNTYY